MIKQIGKLIIILGYIFTGVPEAYPQKNVIDKIVAKVDNEIILESELNLQVEYYIYNNRLDPNIPELKRQVLEAIVNEKLVIAKALSDTNISVSEDEVTQQLDAILAQRVQQLGSERRLEELYGMPLSKIKRESRGEIRKQLLAQKMQQLKFSNVTVTKREVEEFFFQFADSLPLVPEEVEIYHLVKIPEKNPELKQAVIEKAQKILDSLRSSGDFSDFAKRYSQDFGSSIAGGELGFVRRGQLVKEFEEAAFSLEDNQISNLIESPFGIHIIQRIERRGEMINTRHILFKIETDEFSEAITINFLKNIADSIRAGGSFSTFAKRYSDDKETASIGGYLGVIPIDQLDIEFKNVVNSLQIGEISEPMKVQMGSTYGFQLVFLKRRIPEHKYSLDEDYKKLENMALNYKRNKEYQKWIEELRTEIFWELLL